MSGYPPSGMLRKNIKGTDRHPDYRGDLAFSNEVVESLYQQMQNGEEPKVSLAAWLKQGQSGKFLSLSASIFKPAPQTQQGSYQPRSQERPQQPRQQERQVQPQATFDDEIPF